MLNIQDCLNDVRSILKKQPINFKVNKQFTQIIEDTETSLSALGKSLLNIGDTKFMCCGTE